MYILHIKYFLNLHGCYLKNKKIKYVQSSTIYKYIIKINEYFQVNYCE